jgi:integral membrane protein
VTKLFSAYRVLAITVGVFLLAASINWVLSHLSSSVPDLWWLWMLHGYVYIAYLVVAVPFTRKAGWPLSYVALIIVAGLVPVLMFFVEHFVSERYKSEHPEVYAPA